MKQNERLLVYAVTGFLALILVIAVLFGNDPVDANAAKKQESLSKGLSEILQPKDDPATEAEKAKAAAAKADLENKSNEQPLIARPVLASATVERTLGSSRRDRFVRFVPVKRGDAFETLVRRWCGSSGLYLKEALCLNEEVTMLREGTEVAVPWVDDEVLAAIIEAQAPRTMINRGSGGPVTRPVTRPVTIPAGVPTASNGGNSNGGNSNIGTPTFRMPGSASASLAGSTAPAASPAAAVVHYTVKPGDSLWKIAAKKYGKRHADRMIRAIKQINPGLSDSLRIDQKLKLPAASE